MESTLSIIFGSWDAGMHSVNTSESGVRMEVGLMRDKDWCGSDSSDRPISLLHY